MADSATENTYVFDARGVSKRFRHAAIFGALESLGHGEVMRFINDHDPSPLLHQIFHRYRDQVQISYVLREPEQVIIDFSVFPNSTSEPDGGCGGDSGCSCSS